MKQQQQQQQQQLEYFNITDGIDQFAYLFFFYTKKKL